MTTVKMHKNEVVTGPDLVRRLLRAQFPQWAALPITPVQSAGTDNAIFRLGKELAVRLPRIDWAVGQAEKEHRWLPQLAPHLPLTIPAPVALGRPGEGYPWSWSVTQWLPGANAAPASIADLSQTAVDLPQIIRALQRIDPTKGPPAAPGSRGAPLAARDDLTRRAIAALQGMIDTDAAVGVWEAALQAPLWEGDAVWYHGDLLPGNLLFEHGRLTAVIDFGGLGVGDPACDLMIAWGLLNAESRAVFRAALGVDDATWRRGRGHALSQAALFIPYYLETNPVGVKNAQHLLNNVLS